MGTWHKSSPIKSEHTELRALWELSEYLWNSIQFKFDNHIKLCLAPLTLCSADSPLNEILFTGTICWFHLFIHWKSVVIDSCVILLWGHWQAWPRYKCHIYTSTIMSWRIPITRNIAEGISWVKGSLCFVLKFASPPFSPPLPSGVQI